MKTILIAHNYTENSFASMSYYLAHHLADLGNRVIFISHKPFFKEKEIISKEKGEIIVYSWPTQKRPTSIKDVLWFSKIYFKYKPNVVVGHFVGANITIAMSKVLSFSKAKTFAYYHTLSNQILTDKKQSGIKYKMQFLRKKMFYKLFCNAIVCPSELAKSDLEKYYSVTKGIVVLNPMKDRFKNKTDIGQNISISFLGRLDPSKGILDLIKAFKIYCDKVKTTNIILNIAGTGSQEKEIKELVKNDDNIFYFGGLGYDKIDDYLCKSHFAIIPSKVDNLPTVGLEAMMNQTPLLISNSTGLTEYVQDNHQCFKFDSNQESMISLFERVESSFNQQAQMSVNARNTFLVKFTIDNYCINFSNELLK
ncbi:glycosyltransferase family 4 protein [Flavobacterium sp. MMLR14_040]|uniref:glycosyltransferase family 4 protein n=1 Tax=Flavobacterium sp. MMLR14_040 TaxID=3093843 RepID=UPI00298FE294|nr:glycosyltransferase family 4 protein [Flavobacterium sp. MMLR14_040]MDW8849228.1 glycosyltransferase family 4 protein [Flavobacterium sp. MMLR14_040]